MEWKRENVPDRTVTEGDGGLTMQGRRGRKVGRAKF